LEKTQIWNKSHDITKLLGSPWEIPKTGTKVIILQSRWKILKTGTNLHKKGLGTYTIVPQKERRENYIACLPSTRFLLFAIAIAPSFTSTKQMRQTSFRTTFGFQTFTCSTIFKNACSPTRLMSLIAFTLCPSTSLDFILPQSCWIVSGSSC
jgi:hypothetical protein